MKRLLALLMLSALLAGLLAGCAPSASDAPVTLTIWHVYGGQTDSPLNDLIAVFNQIVGRKQGIRVEVTSVSNTNTIHDAVLAAAYHDPGAPELPDLFCSYPKTVLAMPDESVLVDYRDYFSEAELDAFVPEFLEEGTVGGRVVILPLTKSTEVLFVNRTGFDRFAEATGASMEEFSTWEGVFDMACRYAQWTDALTPDIPGDGKSFFVHDYHFNYFQVGVESLGEDFFADGTVAFGPAFETAWEPYAKAALSGGLWLQSGYATEPLRTGDAIASVASSASVLYYSDTVTYPDNTSEQIRITALPCPTFRDGSRLVMQRGVGLCTVRSTPEREQAAVTFLRWLTDPQQNVPFVTRTGYMPVMRAAFDEALPAAIARLEDPKYVSLYEAYRKTQADYTFYVPPKLEPYLALETRFEDLVRQTLISARARLAAQPEADLDEACRGALEEFRTLYRR